MLVIAVVAISVVYEPPDVVQWLIVIVADVPANSVSCTYA
jgi:hypothetical protein